MLRWSIVRGVGVRRERIEVVEEAASGLIRSTVDSGSGGGIFGGGEMERWRVGVVVVVGNGNGYLD